MRLFSAVVTIIVASFALLAVVILYSDPTIPLSPLAALGFAFLLLAFAGFQLWMRHKEKAQEK